MSFFANVIEQDLNNLGKVAEQQKSQRTIEVENKNIKRTHVGKLAQAFTSVKKTWKGFSINLILRTTELKPQLFQLYKI